MGFTVPKKRFPYDFPTSLWCHQIWSFSADFPANSWIKTLIPQLPADWFKHVGLRLTQCVAWCRRLGCRLHTLDAPMKTKIAADHSWLKKSTAVSVSSWTKLTMYGTYFFLAEVVWSQQSGGWGNQGKCHPDRKSNWKWLEPVEPVANSSKDIMWTVLGSMDGISPLNQLVHRHHFWIMSHFGKWNPAFSWHLKSPSWFHHGQVNSPSHVRVNWWVKISDLASLNFNWFPRINR